MLHMKRPRRWLVLAAASAVFMFGATPAIAAPADVTSTHVGLRAYQRYLSALVANASARKRSIEVWVASLEANCPKVLAPVATSASYDAQYSIGKEAGADAALVAQASSRIPFEALSHSLARLRWSSRRLAATIMRSLEGERRYLMLPPSDLCTDARALAASNGQVTPPGTLRFLATSDARAAAAGLSDISSIFKRFLSPRDHSLFKATTSLQRRLAASEDALGEASEPKVFSALGIP
jgi:hypothetical protein